MARDRARDEVVHLRGAREVVDLAAQRTLREVLSDAELGRRLGMGTLSTFCVRNAGPDHRKEEVSIHLREAHARAPAGRAVAKKLEANMGRISKIAGEMQRWSNAPGLRYATSSVTTALATTRGVLVGVFDNGSVLPSGA